jgi:cytoskeletal protein RodZ
MSKRQQIPTKVTEKEPVERASIYSKSEPKEKEPMIFEKQNYSLFALGAALVAIGLLLMMGGKQPDANTWDPNIIYSFRIISLAPIVILAGLGVTTYGIFKQ